MDKREIAAILDEIGVFLELKGENPFKVRAYQSAARILDRLEDDLGELIKAKQLRSIKGIGAALADNIETLHQEGSLPFYEELKASIEPGLIEMLTIPGLGPKKVKAVYGKLGLTSIDQLRLACEEGKVAALPGFGKQSQAKILSGIEHRELYNQRHLWWDAFAIAEPILEGLRKLKQTEKAEHAGSLRRCLETVGDLDFLVASEDPEPIMHWFTHQEAVAEVTALGQTKSSIRLESGLQADLRVVPLKQFYFALHHFTGSKDHNVMMRQRALSMGYSLSEWGLTPEEGGRKVTTIKSEAALFEKLGLNYIPPELREGTAEIAAAEKGTLPELVQEEDIRGVFHNHTTASDGRHTLEEMVAAAQDLGWEYLGISDHSKSSVQANGLNEERVLKQIEAIEKLNQSKQFKTYVFSGIECDILKDGDLDLDQSVLEALDYVVISIHSGFTQDEASMTRRIIKAIEHPCSTMLGHPTGRLLLEREPYAVNMQKVIDAAIANKVMIEINANPRRLDMDWRLWHKAAEKGLMTCINPDAHAAERLIYYKAGVQVARKGWLTKESVFNTNNLKSVKNYLLSTS